ncbi:hypothetical protein EC988_000031 [Linderina pennispora]|nr:hypothetical protein EC988_000031 [Linderina pennispora]
MKCKTCEFECASADLYFDHLLFDARHHEILQQRMEELEKHESTYMRPTKAYKRASLVII